MMMTMTNETVCAKVWDTGYLSEKDHSIKVIGRDVLYDIDTGKLVRCGSIEIVHSTGSKQSIRPHCAWLYFEAKRALIKSICEWVNEVNNRSV